MLDKPPVPNVLRDEKGNGEVRGTFHQRVSVGKDRPDHSIAGSGVGRSHEVEGQHAGIARTRQESPSRMPCIEPNFADFPHAHKEGLLRQPPRLSYGRSALVLD